METKIYKQTFNNLVEDLTETRKAELKEVIFEIINTWVLECKENHKNFREAFLSNKLNKYFNKIKKAIGEFKGISKMSVLDFLAKIILGYVGEYDEKRKVWTYETNEELFFIELHEEYLLRREEFDLNYFESKIKFNIERWKKNK